MIVWSIGCLNSSQEFLPMLKELQELDDNYRKYKIDMKLKRYSTALEHISKCTSSYCTKITPKSLSHSSTLHHPVACWIILDRFHFLYTGDDKFTECMDLINEHELYGEAMTLFNEGSIKYNTICKSYAKHLASKNKYEEVGARNSSCAISSVGCCAEYWSNVQDSWFKSQDLIPLCHTKDIKKWFMRLPQQAPGAESPIPKLKIWHLHYI